MSVVGVKTDSYSKCFINQAHVKYMLYIHNVKCIACIQLYGRPNKDASCNQNTRTVCECHSLVTTPWSIFNSLDILMSAWPGMKN